MTAQDEQREERTPLQYLLATRYARRRWTPGQARRFATAAHAGVDDKIGRPYIEHPVAVAAIALRIADKKMTRTERRHLLMVCYLHDVTEDTEITSADLLEAGLPLPVVTALRLLDHSDNTPYDEYVSRLAPNWLARTCKRADLRHNTEPSRRAALPDDVRERMSRKYETKYRPALAYLDSYDPDSTAHEAQPARSLRSQRRGVSG